MSTAIQLREPIQTDTEVQTATNAIPQIFAYENEELTLHSGSSDIKKVAGSVVYNKEKPGSFGYVACFPQQEINGKQTQRMVANVSSNHEYARSTAFDFYASPELGASRQGELTMQVTHYDPMLGKSQKLFPIIVGPGSVSLGKEYTKAELALLGVSEEDFALSVNWGKIASGVLSAIPTLAKTGLDIYKEVTKVADEEAQEAPEGWISTIGSIAQAALPFVAALI